MNHFYSPLLLSFTTEYWVRTLFPNICIFVSRTHGSNGRLPQSEVTFLTYFRRSESTFRQHGWMTWWCLILSINIVVVSIEECVFTAVILISVDHRQAVSLFASTWDRSRPQGRAPSGARLEMNITKMVWISCNDLKKKYILQHKRHVFLSTGVAKGGVGDKGAMPPLLIGE